MKNKIITVVLVALLLVATGVGAYFYFCKSSDSNLFKVYTYEESDEEQILSFNDLSIRYKSGEYFYLGNNTDNKIDLVRYGLSPKIIIFDKNYIIINGYDEIKIFDEKGVLVNKIDYLNDKYMRIDDALNDGVKVSDEGLKINGTLLVNGPKIYPLAIKEENTNDNLLLDCNVYNKYADLAVKGTFEIKYLGNGSWDELKNISYTSLKDTDIKCVTPKANSNGAYELNLDLEYAYPGSKVVTSSDLSINTILDYLGYVPREYEGTNEPKDAYSKDSTLVSDVSDDLLLKTAISKTNQLTGSELEEAKKTCSDACGVKSFYKTSEVLANLKKMYNTDVLPKDFTVSGGGATYEGEYITIYHGKGNTPYSSKSTILDYKLTDDELIIREKAVFLLEKYNEGSTDVYVVKKTEISEDNTIYKQNIVGTYEYEFDQEKSKIDLRSYLKDSNTFIHTFKKNSDGTYYYYQTKVEK